MSFNNPGLFKRVGMGLLCVVFLGFMGCSKTQSQSAITPVQDPCAPASSSLTLEALQQENERLLQQVAALSNLPAGVGISDLYQVVEVQLTRYTGLYDKDKDGQVDHLSVYLRPLDADGDVIKAAGDVAVQLWDLSGREPESLLKTWKIPSEQLRKQWFSSMLTINYRLQFSLQTEWTDPDLSLTVRVLFKDYLTGRELTVQMPVKPRP